MLTGKGLFLTYQDGETTIDAVCDVNITVPSHQFLGILGPSGSGKSSLLYLLSGLKPPTRGDVAFGERRYSEMNEAQRVALRREKFGFVFQQHFLINYLTALENVLTAAPRQDKASVERATELLVKLGLKGKLHRFPYQLSGGERQRVAVARAMINEPEIIFADEPTGLLDHPNGHQVMDLLTLYRDVGSVIVVTHDPDMLVDADRVIHLWDGQIVA